MNEPKDLLSQQIRQSLKGLEDLDLSLPQDQLHKHKEALCRSLREASETLENIDFSDEYKERRKESSTTEKLGRMIKLANRFSDPFSDPQQFYADLLKTCLSLIEEADYGTIAHWDGNVLQIVASKGHDQEQLRNLKFTSAKPSSFETVSIVDYSTNPEDFPLKGAELMQWLKAAQPLSESLVTVFPSYENHYLLLTLDIGQDNPYRFRSDSVKVFETFSLLASSYLRIRHESQDLHDKNEELLLSNIRLETSYQEVEKLWIKLKKMIDLSIELGKSSSIMEDFYNGLLKTALSIIEEGDYASISLVDKKRWQFVSAIGHDIRKLRQLQLKPEYCILSDKVLLLDQTVSPNGDAMPADVLELFSQATRPINRSMTVSLDAGQSYKLILSVDIRKGSQAKFRKSSIKIFHAFANLAGTFLKIRLSNELVRTAYIRFAGRLSVVGEAYDVDTAWHNHRVGEISAFIAEKYGLSPQTVEDIRMFAPLHDIGKLFIDRSILNKKSDLTPEEFELIKMHTLLAGNLLDEDIFKIARNIAMYHHEKFDGSGYPCGFVGNDIPLEAQIVGLADVYDALRSERPYKKALNHVEALSVLTKSDGKIREGHFRPDLIKLLIQNSIELNDLYTHLLDQPNRKTVDNDFLQAMLEFTETYKTTGS